MRLTRGQQTVRNLILCVLLGTLSYTALGFPPYTVQGMLDRVERQYLLSGLEPLLVKRNSLRYSNDFFSWHTTSVLARTGDTYVYASWSRHFLEVWPEYGRNLNMGRDALCTAIDGTLYVAGPFENAASAAVEITVERTTQVCDPETEEYTTALGEQRTYSYPGIKVNNGIFSFRYREEGESWLDESSLSSTSREWYREYLKGSTGGGYSIIHADLPVKVTLYDGDGGVLEILALTIDNYEFDSRW